MGSNGQCSLGHSRSGNSIQGTFQSFSFCISWPGGLNKRGDSVTIKKKKNRRGQFWGSLIEEREINPAGVCWTRRRAARVELALNERVCHCKALIWLG